MPDTAEDALAAALRSLYAVVPEEFMAERKRLVAAEKADGDPAVAKEIGALRKPSLAAWAVNLLAREAPDLVDSLADLGGRMRAAQARLDTGTLTSLRPERDQLLEEVVQTTVRLVADAGRTCSPAAQQDVRATAIAALADEQAMTAVASGQLARPLSYSGFGEVDLSEAVVRTTSGAILSVVRGGDGASGPRDAAGAEGAGDADEDDDAAPDEEQLSAALAAAEKSLARAEADVTRARERAEETRERLAVVERQLAKAREADERALEAVTDAVRARKSAEASRQEAQEALDRAQSDT
ncbi:hypothetical protein SAMN04489867_2750 [Pedococcus dokdonensis]|uniref:Uncharacterized protein n=1 Tax=Pedococcus dokdonensis TaxID=443156 RepID=A0A1H0TDC3_9MICO|nr:hypothetical protein [Pedococcus dokdonensis]SDP52004.1 hypothetical protein SAMN04489867_2750 [Pedococcus dokdonensis]